MAIGFARVSNVHNMRPLPPLRWSSPNGSLGTHTEHDTFFYEFRVSALYAVTNFTVIQGALPPGLTLNEMNGELTGTFGWVEDQQRFDFTIEIRDNFDNTITGRFHMIVREYITEVNWITEEGQVAEQSHGGPIVYEFKAKSRVV